MADILLTTLNARYAHAAFGLRYLLANLGDLRDRARVVEFDIAQRPVDIVEQILAHHPRIVGVGVYIWNVQPATEVVALLKRLRPGLTIVLGGPEVSHETEQQEIVRHADYVIAGEADLAFARLCREILGGRAHGQEDEGGHAGPPLQTPSIVGAPLRGCPSSAPPTARVIGAQPPAMDELVLPYDLYDDQDLAHRVVYIEASRGCPFRCEFCLSSLDVPVRNVPLERFLTAMQTLLDRGLRQFKFVDRTFNLNVSIGREILRFFHERYRPGLFLHFEMIPDRLPEGLREWIARFPAGALQFEVGIQTFNEEVAARISRRQDNAKVQDNFRFLREQTGVHIHADLIAGLPGESIESFAAGFDRLVALGPQEIQVGILKRLRGTPIARHSDEWAMVYSPHAPYEILQNKLIDFATMQRLRRLARYWDLVANSGNFVQTVPLVWAGDQSPFWSFLRLSDWLYARTRRTHGIALSALAELLFEYLSSEVSRDPSTIAHAMWQDFQRIGRSDKPPFLRPHIDATLTPAKAIGRTKAPPRQERHLAP